MYYLHKSAACLAAYPEKGLSLCSGAPMGTLVVAHSVGTVSTSDLAVALGCIGKARVPNPSPFPLVVGFSLPEFVDEPSSGRRSCVRSSYPVGSLRR